jgi:hypothetical protein
MSTEEKLRVVDVFVPGRLPAYTYNPRDSQKVEGKLQDYLDELGKILTIAGPTKTGKTVLLENQLASKNALWIQGQGLDSVETLWGRVADLLGLPTTSGGSRVISSANAASGEVSAGAMGSGVKASYSHSGGVDEGATWTASRPLDIAASQELRRVRRPLVLDDVHFIERGVQTEIIRALKPLAFSGVPIIFVSIGHRVRDLMTAEPDMGGRLYNMDVGFWSKEELKFIAERGFKLLRLQDTSGIATRLADQSFGSPHLMQQFCREICKENGIREEQESPVVLSDPPSWPAFFAEQLDGGAESWSRRLATGPQEHGKPRTKYQMRDGRSLDGYELLLTAMAKTGPRLELSKADITHKIDELVTGGSPTTQTTTQKLQHMSRIAATRLNEVSPSTEELENEEAEGTDPYAGPDIQPVLEYIEDGPNSRLHIADPFFAFYLAWGINKLLPHSKAWHDGGEG